MITGPEPLLVLEAADAVRARAREEGCAEREVFDADGRDFDWDPLQATFHAPSLFSARRLIELRMPTARPGKAGAEVITDFCAQPPADVVLLVTGGEWSKKHGGKWSEAIARTGCLVVARQVRPDQMTGWVEARLRKRGVKADRGAVQRLVERVEGNLLAAAQEIDKLVLLADGEPIDAARMESLVADAARFDVFRMLDAALTGQGARTSRMLAGLRAEGQVIPAPMGMVGKGGVKAERWCVLRLGERFGGDLRAAAEVIDKLVLLADGGPIDAARMESLVADAARFDVFRMLDAALNGQGARTSRMLAGLRAEGQVIPALMGMVVKELLTVATLARVQARGGNMAAEFKIGRAHV